MNETDRLFTEATRTTIMAKLLGKKADDGSRVIEIDVDEAVGDFLKDIEQRLVYPLIEAAEAAVKRDVAELLNDIYFELDRYDDPGNLTLKFLSNQNGGMIDFHHPVITLYELIVGTPDEGETEVITEYDYLSRMLTALEGVVEKIKNTKTWSTFPRSKDEQLLTLNERIALEK